LPPRGLLRIQACRSDSSITGAVTGGVRSVLYAARPLDGSAAVVPVGQACLDALLQRERLGEDP
jgi:hypothetical protein